MKKPKKPLKSSENPVQTDAQKENTVRGSGFTYDEDQAKTDVSKPLDEAGSEEIVKLPDLGKPGRP
jgi:hypothetical protein